MKSAVKRRQSNLRPKHKQTKEYLKHYYPFLPLFASIGFLLFVIFAPAKTNHQSVLGFATNVSQGSLLEATNSQRKSANVGELTSSEQLTAAAQKKAQDMVARNYWSHKTPEGTDPWSFISKENYSFKKAGENLAYGFDSSSDVITGWMNSTSHRENMLDKDFTQVGFGTADSNNFNGGGKSTVVVAMYAQPIATNGIGGSTQDPVSHILGEGKTISTVQALTQSSWAVYAVGIVLGASIMYIVLIHGIRARRAVTQSQKYVIKNPLLDSAVISLIAVGILLLKAAGAIL